ncbi:UDP-N-acetylmuramoyl-tripeptide--D-alanyl-D-alanine ligase [Deferribacteraceae bacterium V6Fe1]|nr:UDP-N-acetylmuramoyl-tripeptide--D-alanyl-D-alanine ligase [Deferribacteraceae bacterium V6Fe1]
MRQFEIDKYLKKFESAEVNEFLPFKGVSIDSRTIKKGEIFIGLKGENFDGNLFAERAAANGASLLILDNEEVFKKINYPKVLVKNSLIALKEIGGSCLSEFGGKLICITGSAGKTTAKKMVSDVLNSKYKVFTAYKNYNNEIGVALNAANLDLDAEYAVFEIGTNNPGEIELLAKYLSPDVSIITNIGKSHIGRFKSIENIAKEKLTLLNYTKKVSYLYENCLNFIGNSADIIVSYGISENNSAVISDIYREGNKLNFSIKYKDKKYNLQLNHIYRHFVYNATAAAILGLDEGLEIRDIQYALKNFTPEEHRGNVIETGVLTIVDDTYNCSFESLVEAIKNFSELNNAKKYAIVGEMAEIEGFEDEFYEKIYNLACSLKGIQFTFFGEKYKKYDENGYIEIITQKEKLLERLSSINDGIVLLKASRSKKFDEYVDYLKTNTKRRSNAL